MFELLVGSAAFFARMRDDADRATRRVLVQAMTFEGDAAGQAAAAAVRDSRAEDRRILVDAYTRFIVSDRFVYAPYNLVDRTLQDEVRATSAMFAEVERSGGQVRFTNPVGPCFVKFPARNHKKLVICDDAAYVGGINFSDHNFAWHDLMVRIEDRAVADHLAGDFDATFRGAPEPSVARFGNVTVCSFDGASNPAAFEALFERIRRASETITVVSPYLTFPFCEALREARRRGVRVTLLTPRGNNKGVVRDYLLWESARSGFEVRLYDGMSHLKAMLIDDRALVLGSSNFDFVSYHAQEELLVVLEDEALVRDFRARVLDPDLARSIAPDGAVRRGRRSYLALKIAEGATRVSRALF